MDMDLTSLASRVPEPEYMTEEEEICYAAADYSIPHEALAQEVVKVAAGKPRRVVDLGCGPGDVLLRIRRHAPDWDLTGADISPRMLAIARDAQEERLAADTRRIHWLLTNGRNLACADGSFDVVMSNSVLHHVADAVQFWREIRRIAEEGAHVFVRDLRRPPDEATARALVSKHVGGESQVVQAHYLSSLRSSYTCAEVRSQLAAARIGGLEVRELEDRYLTVGGCLSKI
ncbi:class I SAM-dependent methyltransferase [Rhizobium helianthi]|uniref:Class I SAM-dependent methyltransferase n=1 Tax=Rhizobium helianthi TaxID=1132695 RepID=A0ABW4MAA0_9HYPH